MFETQKLNMGQIYTTELSQHVGEEVTLKGWLYNMRSSGKLLFPQLRDGTGIVQCVVAKNAVASEIWEALKPLGQESSLVITGSVREDNRAPGGVEIDVRAAQVLQNAHDYPITPKEHGTEFLLDNRHLWLRSKKQHAILKVRHTVVKAVRDFLDHDGFTLCDTPIFTPAACEGTTTLFEVDYFGDEKAYLTQSGQLYNEATAAAFGKAYCFGPTFRAEKSKTRRHLTEFWMVEPEVAYLDLDGDMELMEQFLSFVVGRALEKHETELQAMLERAVKQAEEQDDAPEGYGEIIGGGRREDDLDKLLAELEKHKLPRQAFEWYLDLRRYGSVPHAGFGMGVERCVAWICGLHHVRETIPFARMTERITP